jgi:hypothetical protein
VLIADVDGDGKNDIIYPCRDSCQSLVYFNDGKGNFTRAEKWGPANSSIRATAVAGFDGDGHLDIAAPYHARLAELSRAPKSCPHLGDDRGSHRCPGARPRQPYSIRRPGGVQAWLARS